MKKTSALLLIALFCSMSIVQAANSPTNSPATGSKSDSKGRGFPFHGTIAAIDKSAKTITMRGEKQRVYYVKPETKINKDKIRSTLNALAVGDYVGGFAREAADGKRELVTLNIGTASAAKPKAPDGKAGK